MFEFLAEAFGLAFPWVILVMMVLGVMGLIVPIFPGNTVVWAAALVYALVTGFDGRAWWFFVPISILTVIATSSDNILMGAKAHQAGASWVSIAIALVAGFVTSLVLTPLGGLVAAPVVLFVSEFFRNKKDSKKAWQITSSLMVGWGMAFVVRFSLGVMVTGLYVWWAFGQ